jgi:class 3 adenylate cyclase
MSNPDGSKETFDLERTWLVSVLFVDMVKYSTQSQEVQAQWRSRFKQYLNDGLADTVEHDRIILDCGDGAAIVFLGEPEAAMTCALSVLGNIVQEKGPAPKPMHVRIGINLGSVKLVRDINGNMAAAGDGINVGQRIMSFAGDNQILVSRSFFEVASLLTEGYAALFRAEGIRKDKHQREHMVYELHLPNAAHPAPVTNTMMIRKIAPQFAANIKTVEHHLALLVGPIAHRIVQSAGQRAGSATELRNHLLTFIPEKPDQEKFLTACGDIFPAAPAAGSFDTTQTTILIPKPVPHLDPAVLERARKDLALYVGPMAKVLVNRAATKTSTRVELYQALAVEIPSAKDREQFLKQSGQ